MEFLPIGQTLAVTAALSMAFSLAALVVIFRSLIRTTLAAPVAWAGLAIAVVGAIESATLWFDWHTDWRLPPLRFAAAVLMFCPVMSVLGARKPHDWLWQWIVLSLWGVLIMPAAEVAFIRPGRDLEVHDLRGWFLWVLLLIQLVNYPPIFRFGWAAWIATFCQGVLLADYLPMIQASPTSEWRIGAIVVLAVAAVGVASQIHRKRRPAGSDFQLQRAWCEFRDLYGALWAMRLAQRINAAAAICEWPIRAGLGGFSNAETGEPLEELPQEFADPFRKNVRNLFRRFFAPDWLKSV